MKPRTAKELLDKVRLAYREPAPSEDLAMPAGFAARVVSGLAPRPRAGLLLWERVSYAGLATAAVIALFSWMSVREMESTSASAGVASELWLDMPTLEDF